jgi:hypothetical protein
VPSIEVGFDHRSEPPTFPDAVYDEIADALVAEVESGGSSGIVADKRYVGEGAEGKQRRSTEKVQARRGAT